MARGPKDDWSTDDDREIDNFQFSPQSSLVHRRAETVVDPFEATTSRSPAETTMQLVQTGLLDVMFARLVEMEFPIQMIVRAIQENGPNADTSVIIDTIYKFIEAEEEDDSEEQHDAKKRRTKTNTMVGFGIPNEAGPITEKSLPEVDRGPPFFYYENSTTACEGVWETMKRYLFDIEPEFVDSKHICAAARKSGYIHNLFIKNRFMPEPTPKYTIGEALPVTKKWWPAWDERTKLNSISTFRASGSLLKRIYKGLQRYGENPPPQYIKEVIVDCKHWNIVWVGKNKPDNLEPREMETLLGFPSNYTRGLSDTARNNILGNSSQVDTMAYHLSVLKPMFNNGITVLSLFTGIGAGVVALHRLQIPMKAVVSVEISKDKRDVLQDFWEKTSQTGALIQYAYDHSLTDEKIEELMVKYGGFDLVIGCNRIRWAKQLPLFFQYCRILGVVRERMRGL